MKYYKYRDEESLIGSGVRYVEAEDGRSFREVIVSRDSFLASFSVGATQQPHAPDPRLRRGAVRATR